jgi:F-type H+-transporting ATPase subunit alpha
MVAASEVSSILESRISGTAVGGNVEETGRVLSMSRPSNACVHLVERILQALVMVLGVFGVCGMCKVCWL